VPPWLHTDPPELPFVNQRTSKAAAIAAEPRAGTVRRRVLDVIRDSGERGATDDEIEARLGLRHQTASPRRTELLNSGHVVDSGMKRRTRSGHDAIAWIAVRGEPIPPTSRGRRSSPLAQVRAQLQQAEAALRIIAAEDELVRASGGAWSLQAYERRRDVARAALEEIARIPRR
jgi:hypothetical protein